MASRKLYRIHNKHEPLELQFDASSDNQSVKEIQVGRYASSNHHRSKLHDHSDALASRASFANEEISSILDIPLICSVEQFHIIPGDQCGCQGEKFRIGYAVRSYVSVTL